MLRCGLLLLLQVTSISAQFSFNFTNRIAEVIESPNYPDDYLANQVVTWRVDSGNDWTALIIVDISLESSLNCTKDSVTSQSFLMTWSQYTCEPHLNRTASFINPNNMFITFRSDSAVQSKGFRGVVMAVPANNYFYATTPTKTCVDDSNVPVLLASTTSTQFFALPGWPVTYPASRVCGYSIASPSNKYVVRLRRIFMDLGSGDKLNIYNSKSKTGRFCPDTTWEGSQLPVVDFIAEKDYIYVEFRSDSVQQNKGFYIGYEAVPVNYLPTTPSGCDNTPYIIIISCSVAGVIFLGVFIGLVVWCKKTGRCNTLGNLEEEDLPMPKKRKINQRRLRRRMNHPGQEEEAEPEVRKSRPPRVITHAPRPKSNIRPVSSNPGNVHNPAFQESHTNGVAFPGTIDYI